jgi:hypothetical protein
LPGTLELYKSSLFSFKRRGLKEEKAGFKPLRLLEQMLQATAVKPMWRLRSLTMRERNNKI